MPRRARLDAPGMLQHVMVRGIERKRIASDEKNLKNLTDRMGDLAVETDTVIYAWALMSNPAYLMLRSGSLGLKGNQEDSCIIQRHRACGLR
jgi:putative transposase